MMRIARDYQYNQGIGRSKLFSSVAGVGAIVISKFGTSSLVLCIEEWGIMKKVNSVIEEVEKDIAVEKDHRYASLKNRLKQHKIELIQDQRFLEFIRLEQGLPNLFVLVNVPHISLNETFNTIEPESGNWRSDPILNYFIPSIHFPSFFMGRKKMELRPLDWWKKKWKAKNRNLDFFAPPRDHSTCEAKKVEKDNIGKFKPLIQSNLVFICRHGHLSNIPWSKYLYWKNQKFNPSIPRSNDFDEKARNLFLLQDCCSNPKLHWTENRNTSEGYSNIWLECKNGNCITEKVTLEGINSIQPRCPGHKPWEMSSRIDDNFLPHSHNCTCRETRITMISASSIYYSRTFTNIYLPLELASGISEEVALCLEKQEKKFKRLNEVRGMTKEEYANERITDVELEDNYKIQIQNDPEFVSKVREAFLNGGRKGNELDRENLYENYRFQEFKAFTSNKEFISNKKLSFFQISVPQKLQPYFDVISRIDMLAESQIQLGFSRITPLDSDDSDNQMSIYRSRKEEVRSLPSIQSLGEGVFFSINKKKLDNWISSTSNISNRINQVLSVDSDMNTSTRMKLELFGLRFLLIHSLCHLLMKGLEFNCGYPTSSLKERLYVSDRMNGFLIYTSEGSEGSMGGLVSQTEEENLIRLFDKSFQEAYECSSDPLCWESTSQGVSGLNLAACFSCSLISETSCEEFNLGLDRRVVIDPEFGFFKDYVF